MMVNYKAIADAYADGAYIDYQAAYDAMSQQTEAGPALTLSGNDLRIWSAMNATDYELLLADTGTLSKIAVKLIETPDSRLTMSDPRVQGFIGLLPISQEGKDNLTSMADNQVKTWPGLELGHIQNAVQMRQEGRI